MRARLWLNAGLILATLWLARELPVSLDTVCARQSLHPGEQTLPHLVLAFQPYDSAWHPWMWFWKEARGPYGLASAATHWLILVYTLGLVALGRVRR